MRPHSFKDTVECIQFIRNFIIEHFGPLDDAQRLDNRLEAMEFMYESVVTELELYRTMFGVLEQNKRTFDKMGELDVVYPVSDTVWKLIKKNVPHVSGSQEDMKFETLNRCRLPDAMLRQMDPEIMGHKKFTEQYLAVKRNLE